MAETYSKQIQSHDIYKSKYYNIYRQNNILLEEVIVQFVFINLILCKAALKLQ